MCDKEWHHYVLNVEFPTVTLYVDGVPFDPFPVTEDYPLHPSRIESQLVVGACWQGNGPPGSLLGRQQVAVIVRRSTRNLLLDFLPSTHWLRLTGTIHWGCLFFFVLFFFAAVQGK